MHYATIAYPAGLDFQMVANLLTNAWDSGAVAYWGIRGATTVPGNYTPPKSHPEMWEAKYVAPMLGGSVVFFDSETCDMDDDDQPHDWTLDGKAIQRGLDCFHEQAPRHYVDAIRENDDAETADVFVQLCLFGEIVYG